MAQRNRRISNLIGGDERKRTLFLASIGLKWILREAIMAFDGHALKSPLCVVPFMKDNGLGSIKAL